jgi:hypothetical protein
MTQDNPAKAGSTGWRRAWPRCSRRWMPPALARAGRDRLHQRGPQGKAIGECWDNRLSADGHFEIFIRPTSHARRRDAGADRGHPRA